MPDRKTALVTGGAKRIGRAIVEDLARHGWSVAIHYHRSRKAAEEAASFCRQAGVKAALVEADLALVESLAGMVKAAETALGPVSLLVNNASIFEEDHFGGLDPEHFHHQFNINLVAPIFLAQLFAGQLPPDEEGNIVNLVDERAWKPTPKFFTYQLSKSALLDATKVMAQALAPRIRVNAIGPGPTLPSLRQDPQDFAHQAELVPLGRPAALEEFGRTVRYLVETRSITGQMIALDGGQHLAWQTPDVTEATE